MGVTREGLFIAMNELKFSDIEKKYITDKIELSVKQEPSRDE